MANDRGRSNSSRITAIAAVVAGTLLALGALFADVLGIGGEGAGIGWKQLIAAIVGVIIALIGVAVLIRPGIPAQSDR